MRVVVIVPPGAPIDFGGINYVASSRAFHMAIAAKKVRVKIVPVTRALRMLLRILHVADLRIQICIELDGAGGSI